MNIIDNRRAYQYFADKLKIRDIKNINKIVLHCSDTQGWSVSRLVSFHILDRKFPACGYHYFINDSGINYITDIKYITTHAKLHNKSSIGIAIDYSPTLEKRLGGTFSVSSKRNQHILDQAIELIADLCNQLNLNETNVYGHRELFGTGWLYSSDNKIISIKECPGNKINLNDVRKRVKEKMSEKLIC